MSLHSEAAEAGEYQESCSLCLRALWLKGGGRPDWAISHYLSSAQLKILTLGPVRGKPEKKKRTMDEVNLQLAVTKVYMGRFKVIV